MTIDTDRITGCAFWRDAAMLRDVLTRDDDLTVEDDRLLRRGPIGTIKGVLGRASARRRGRELVEALFRLGDPRLDLAETPVAMILEEDQMHLLLLPPTGRVMWFNGFEHFDVPGVTVWSCGYLSDGGWLWTDLNRVEHIRGATIGNGRFMNGVLKPGRIQLAREAEALRPAA